MSCSPFDLRDYFLKELAVSEQSQMEAHVRSCAECRTELDRLRLTEAALFALREEEIPQRIAFVSDKIFEPSRWRRAWTTFWGSGARLGFAGAGMLSVAILVLAFTRPATIVQAPATAPPVLAASATSDSEIQARIDAAVSKAVSAAEARQADRNKRIVAEVEQARLRLLLAADELDRQQRKLNVATLSASLYVPPPDGEEAK